MKLLLLCSLIAALDSAHCARILAVLPLAAKSHHAFFQPILKALAQRGHNITVYSPFSQKKPVPNYTDVFLETPLSDVKNLNEAFLEFVRASQFSFDRTIWDTVYPTCENAFQQEMMIKLMESSEKFDLVITEALVGQESMLAFGHKFQAPTIALQSKSACTIDNKVSGNSLSISYIPDVGLPYSNSMTFLERLLNAYTKLSTLFSYNYYQIPRQEALLRKHFKDPMMPPLIDMVNNISLMFTLGHSTPFYAQPNTPNIIPLGGIHIDTERKPLPQDIKNFMDGAKDGVIYFSLGTYVPDDTMGKEYFRNYINVFKKLPQRILWKTRAEDLEELPENILIGKWMPQQDILAHPKCVLFITHGGLLSQHEVMHFGIPVIGVPYFADQPMNVRLYEEFGMGVKLDFRSLTEKNIYSTITTVLGDPRFTKNAKKMSQIFREQPLSPADSVVFWTEYVMRHDGAGHLKPASTQLNWFQLAMLDVVAAILAATLIIIATLYLVIRKMCNCFVKKQETLSRSKTKIKHS